MRIRAVNVAVYKQCSRSKVVRTAAVGFLVSNIQLSALHDSAWNPKVSGTQQFRNKSFKLLLLFDVWNRPAPHFYFLMANST